VNALSTAGEPGSAALSSTRRRRDPVPSGVTLTQPRNHRDPAMAFHLAGASLALSRRLARPPGDVLRDPRENTVTSPATGADSAPDPPGYAPISRSAPGPQSVTGRASSPGATVGGGNRRLGLALVVIATAQLMVMLDATIVNVALPHIQQALGFSGSGLEWVVNAYAVTFGGLLLLGGRAGLFFFLTLFIQGVLGYSAIRTGVAYLPFPVGVVIASGLASQLVPRIGPRPLIVAGAAAVAGEMFWFSRLTEHAGYAGHLLGPQLVSSFGLGLVFVPLALVALHNVAEQDSGVASSLLDTAQQVGGAIGLALLGTVAWTTVADSVRSQVAHAAAAAAKAGRPLPNHHLGEERKDDSGARELRLMAAGRGTR
jgi:MFS transporter